MSTADILILYVLWFAMSFALASVIVKKAS